MIVVYPYKTLFRKIIGGVFTKLFTRNTLFSVCWYYVTIVDACFFHMLSRGVTPTAMF
jgi:hypothetical protein